MGNHKDEKVWITTCSNIVDVRSFLQILLMKVDLDKILILNTSCKRAELNLEIIPEENVKPINNEVNSAVIFGNVYTLQHSFLLVIDLLLLDSIVNPVLIVVNSGLSLLVVRDSLLNLMPIVPLSIAVILPLILLENLDAHVHLVIHDELEVNIILQVLELRCVDPFDFLSLILPTVLKQILSDVLDDVYFLLNLEFEDGDLQDVDGHVLLNHLLIC